MDKTDMAVHMSWGREKLGIVDMSAVGSDNWTNAAPKFRVATTKTSMIFRTFPVAERLNPQRRWSQAARLQAMTKSDWRRLQAS
jgi:hypothetical protein